MRKIKIITEEKIPFISTIKYNKDTDKIIFFMEDATKDDIKKFIKIVDLRKQVWFFSGNIKIVILQGEKTL